MFLPVRYLDLLFESQNVTQLYLPPSERDALSGFSASTSYIWRDYKQTKSFGNSEKEEPCPASRLLS